MVQVTREFVHHCLPVRKRDGHKGTFGKVHILAGSVGLTGAAAKICTFPKVPLCPSRFRTGRQ